MITNKEGFTFLSKDKEVMQGFLLFKRTKFSVFIEPTRDLLEKYLPDEKETLIVKPLFQKLHYNNK